ncbi:MAG: alpha/beta hydrolase [Actinomycetota bacterium]
MATAHINGIDIRYEDSGGDGPVLLFSHGFLMDHTMFDPQVAHFADRYRCIRWDERGFGDTPAGGDFTYWDSAADAVGVLDACGVEQAVWVGMSQGGYLSLRGALAHPERVGALVLIDSSAHVDPPEAVEGYQQMLGAMTGDDDEVWAATAEIVAGLILGEPDLNATWIQKWADRRPMPDLPAAGGALLGRDDISGRIGEIGCPVLSIHGTEDQAIPLEAAQAVIDGVQDGRRLVEVPGAAHAPNLSHPEVVNAAIDAFLAEL